VRRLARPVERIALFINGFTNTSLLVWHSSLLLQRNYLQHHGA
jgi:hypothetical protein